MGHSFYLSSRKSRKCRQISRNICKMSRKIYKNPGKVGQISRNICENSANIPRFFPAPPRAAERRTPLPGGLCRVCRPLTWSEMRWSGRDATSTARPLDGRDGPSNARVRAERSPPPANASLRWQIRTRPPRQPSGDGLLTWLEHHPRYASPPCARRPRCCSHGRQFDPPAASHRTGRAACPRADERTAVRK